ncbi:hypothetical protein MNBD_GAMMA17-31 [hydrothermal vent metagenome]|uniref:Transposase InsH N-terminal domain-containing protein n=1 Tax=hydrothermal vent metagenome TaxID=652676 RepID=A0A3B0YVQ1_9ZZZZ
MSKTLASVISTKAPTASPVVPPSRRIIIDIIDQLDLSTLAQHYGGSGKQPCHPTVLLALLLFYGYATGVFSSHKLDKDKASLDGTRSKQTPVRTRR